MASTQHVANGASSDPHTLSSRKIWVPLGMPIGATK
jgi:hypothetical protein